MPKTKARRRGNIENRCDDPDLRILEQDTRPEQLARQIERSERKKAPQ
jgi:hypothetical protein